jgi:hypothetical protein
MSSRGWSVILRILGIVVVLAGIFALISGQLSGGLTRGELLAGGLVIVIGGVLSFIGLLLIWRQAANRAMERYHRLDRYVYRASRYLWPWGELRLVALVCLVAILDYTSTYAVLEISGKTNVYEEGWLAGWALQTGGFGALLLVDIAAVACLALIAIALQRVCFMFGFRGYGRAAFIVLLVPYVIGAFVAIANNVALTFI